MVSLSLRESRGGAEITRNTKQVSVLLIIAIRLRMWVCVWVLMCVLYLVALLGQGGWVYGWEGWPYVLSR